MTSHKPAHDIVIVGGGAGGLELATRLGNKLGRGTRAKVTLIDAAASHVWKPLLHEVAAGSLDSYAERQEYLAQAHWHHFNFGFGSIDGLDRTRQQVWIAAKLDQYGQEIMPRRSLHYDTLVIAIGSVGNDFGIPGVAEHCIMLDTPEQARQFHRRHIDACLHAQTQTGPVAPGQITVGIVGTGATGVDLAAALHDTTRELSAYGLKHLDPGKSLRLVREGAAEHILPGLPQHLTDAVTAQLHTMGIEIHNGEHVVEVRENGMLTHTGKFFHASMMVWAAGIKAPDVLTTLGLPTNHAQQLIVRPTLQTEDDAIFAFGDCAARPLPDGKGTVPARAQAAHQQASLLVKSISCRLNHKPLPQYVYRDYGSLVALGQHRTVGNLMGRLSGKGLMIEGLWARLMYRSLHTMHLLALHGYIKTALLLLANLINAPNKDGIKLH